MTLTEARDTVQAMINVANSSHMGTDTVHDAILSAARRARQRPGCTHAELEEFSMMCRALADVTGSVHCRGLH